MTRLLDRAVERVRTLSPETQDGYARVLLRLAGDMYHLTPEEEASLAKPLEQAERGEFASDEEVRAVWAKHGLWDCAKRKKSSPVGASPRRHRGTFSAGSAARALAYPQGGRPSERASLQRSAHEHSGARCGTVESGFPISSCGRKVTERAAVSVKKQHALALRRLVLTPYSYLIFYRVDAKDVVIVGIRHAARDPATTPKPDVA